MKRLLTVMAALVIAISAQAQETPPTEILWDTWGVPHIFAPDNEGVFYAFGWAQMHNHGDLILQLYGEARGRAAEYWGGSFIDNDRFVHTVNIPEQARQGYEGLTDEFQSYVDAFVRGINDYAAANPDLLDDTYEVVLPVESTDIVAHGIRTLKYLFVANSWRGAANTWTATSGASLPESAPQPEIGSNAWAVGPSRSASGNAMLVANPHQPWSDWGLWIEAHLVSPDVDAYGAALLGSPVLGIAFNQHLGWSHTVNTHDGWDVYELTLDGDGYLFDGETRAFDVRETSFMVKREDGTVDEIPLTVRESVHGPVMRERPDGKALALRVVGDDDWSRSFAAAEQWWEMAQATNFDEFEAALRDIRIPMFTVIYADKDGNIFYLFNELVPVRDSGDWAFWSNNSLVAQGDPAVIPGESSAYLWTGYHPYDDLPKLLNPESGWVQNANEPPWTATLPPPFAVDDFPAYMLPEPYVWPRPITSMRLLAEDESITYDELLAYKHSTYAELARLVLDDLVAAAQQSDNELIQRAAEVLAAWDGNTDADSVGAVLFTLWAFEHLGFDGFDKFAVPWSIDDPLNTLTGLADPEAAVADLLGAARQLQALSLLGGGIDVPYGDVFRLRWGDVDLPANGSFDLLGTFRIVTFDQDSDLRFRPVHGDSYIAVVEFGEPLRAQVLLSYGNATQAHSPHVGDQLALFAEKQLRDAWLSRDDIEANLARREVFE